MKRIQLEFFDKRITNEEKFKHPFTLNFIATRKKIKPYLSSRYFFQEFFRLFLRHLTEITPTTLSFDTFNRGFFNKKSLKRVLKM